MRALEEQVASGQCRYYEPVLDAVPGVQCQMSFAGYRGPGQCRHTYISQMLTAGMPVEWISKQTGTSPEMIRRRYGKWIDDDAADMVGLAEKKLGLR